MIHDIPRPLCGPWRRRFGPDDWRGAWPPEDDIAAEIMVLRPQESVGATSLYATVPDGKTSD